MKGLIHQFSWILVGRLTGAVVQAGSIALLARWIGPSQFGLFAASYGIAIVLQTAGDFGFTQYIIRLRAVDRDNPAIDGVLKLSGCINLVMGSVLLSLAIGLTFYDYMYAPLMPLAVWIAADKQVELWLGLSLADGKTWQNALSLVFRRVFALGVLIIANLAAYDAFYAYNLGLAVGSTIAAVTVQVRNARVVTPAGRARFRSVFPESRGFYSNSIATQIRNIDTVLVNLILTPTAAGFYGAASRLTTPLRIIPTSFASVLMPAASKSAFSGARSLRRPLVILLLATTLLYVGIAIAMPLVAPLVLGANYAGAVVVIQVVCFGLIFAAVASQLSSILQGFGAIAAVARISWITTSTCLLGIVALAPALGAFGAGMALSASYVVQVAMLLICLIRNSEVDL